MVDDRYYENYKWLEADFASLNMSNHVCILYGKLCIP